MIALPLSIVKLLQTFFPGYFEVYIHTRVILDTYLPVRNVDQLRRQLVAKSYFEWYCTWLEVGVLDRKKGWL